MNLVLENIIFFTYAGMAFLVSVVAILWGGQAKIMGAGALLGSIIAANIFHWLYYQGVLSVEQRSVSYAAIDLALAYAFVSIYNRSSRLQPNRWAGYVAFIQIVMAATSITGAARPEFAQARDYALALNILMIIALLVCIVGFTPKSRREAVGVLKMKWLYLMSDLFRRVIAALAAWRLNRMAKKKRDSSVREIDAHIGAKIREARIVRELSREKLAAAMGVSPSQIQKFESGANRVSASALYALSEVLNVDVSFFYRDFEAPAGLGRFRGSGARD